MDVWVCVSARSLWFCWWWITWCSDSTDSGWQTDRQTDGSDTYASAGLDGEKKREYFFLSHFSVKVEVEKLTRCRTWINVAPYCIMPAKPSLPVSQRSKQVSSCGSGTMELHPKKGLASSINSTRNSSLFSVSFFFFFFPSTMNVHI